MRSPYHCIVVAREIQHTLSDERIGFVGKLVNLPRSLPVELVVDHRHSVLGG
jgi:hypothetical protein